LTDNAKPKGEIAMQIQRIRIPLRGLIRDQRGAAIVEYLIIVGLIAIICIFAYRKFGEAVDTKIKGQTTKVNGI
jgi:Flp pilus assembly pilin Flp